MQKKSCYIFWDSDKVPEDERQIYLQCEECFRKNKKGFPWPYPLLVGRKTIKCNLCNTIIYQRIKKSKKNEENEATD